MTKSIQRLLLALLCLVGLEAQAQTYANEAATVQWPFEGTVDDPVATPADAFSILSFTAGDGVPYAKSVGYGGITYAAFGPTQKATGRGTDNALSFRVQAAPGLTFTPTKFKANVRRFGTDGGKMDVGIIDAGGNETILAEGLIPARNKDAASDKTSGDANWREAIDIDIPADFAAGQECTLVIYLYNMDSGKQAGLNDVQVVGTVDGTAAQVTKHSIAIAANPAEGGTVSMSPNGDSFAEGTPIALSAKKNFGYKFTNWTDATGAVVSEEPAFTYTLNADAVLTANFAAVPTYSLTATAEAPANYYQVQLSPAPEMIDGKAMYEEGQTVTLTAQSNRIITFTSWSDGQTSSEIAMTMDADKTISAQFAAIDYIAAWDFWRKGNAGRMADFAAPDNDADALVLRTEAGETGSWLDKSTEGGASYEGRWCGVNWTTAGLGTYYWQTAVNAAAFTGIKVASSMVYNYNSYTQFLLQYSFDDAEWTTAGTIDLEGAKKWKDTEIELPAECDNKEKIYIRWFPNKESAIDGTSSNNDGSAISGIYILGTAKLIDDGTAPKLIETVPAANAQNAGINGRIVLTFDEKVKAAEGAKATLGDKELEPAVSGATVMFAYKNLDYATQYTFTLPANSIGDLTDNMYAEPITIAFTTKTKPAVAKGGFDFIIPDDGTLRDAAAAANKRPDTSVRYRIFVRKGQYQVPVDPGNTITGSDGVVYQSPVTTITAPNVSIIGEDRDATVLSNTVPDVEVSGNYGPANPIEGLHNSETLFLDKNAKNSYLQDITLRSSMPDSRGRNSAFEDYSDRTACMNVGLVGYQDTYYSGNGRYYFEGGRLRGRTDFLCGKGDAYFNGCDLVMCEAGGYIAVPSNPMQFGYVFRDCTIKKETAEVDGNYNLGRPWGQGTPTARFINTTMEVRPNAGGWGEMSGGWPAQFAEYNSTTASGTVIDLKDRKKIFADTHENNPVLTKAEADALTIAAVMGQGDDWDPTALTEQAAAPQGVKIEEATGLLTWETSDYVLCWAVCKGGDVVAFTTEPSYAVDDAAAAWSVRAANEMGGLSEATAAELVTGISNAKAAATDGNARYYNINGIPAAKSHKGAVIKVEGGKAVKTVRK